MKGDSKGGIVPIGWCRRGTTEPGGLKWKAGWMMGLGLLCACGQRAANAEQLAVSSEPASTTFGSGADPALDGAALDAKVSDAELRRGYGMVDMRFNGCVTRDGDYAISGSSCPPGLFIYGPYVPVPENSEIDVSFEVRPSRRVSIYADIVSQMGSRTLAGLSRQQVDAGQLVKLGYRVHVFNADVNVESRIGIDAEPNTTFEIRNLTMNVR